MPSAGELLRSERLKRSRSLSEIADATRISRRYLEAIEADQVQELPGEFFYKSFLRQYARALELDPDLTRRIVSSAVPIADPDPVPALHQIYERATEGESVRWRPTTGVAIGVLIAVIAGGSGLYALWQRLQTPQEAPARDTVTAAAPPKVTAPAPVQTPPAASTATTAQPPPQAGSEPAAAPGQTTLSLTATESVWVQVSSDGAAVFTGTLQPDTPRQFPIGASAKLLTGNAGGLQVSVNGKPVGPLGPRGQIRTVLFTGGVAQIVQPKPKTPDEP